MLAPVQLQRSKKLSRAWNKWKKCILKKKAKKAFSLKTISDHFRQVKSGEDRNKGSEKAMSKVHSAEMGNRTMKKVKVA